MENFPSFAKAAWQTDSGAQTFCLPIASVIRVLLQCRHLQHLGADAAPNPC